MLADELAARCGGQVRRSFHTDTEPSTVPGVGVFRHLSPAFDVVDADGRPVARLVDDITIEADLAPGARTPGTGAGTGCCATTPGCCGWSSGTPTPTRRWRTVLDPVAELFGVRAEVVGSRGPGRRRRRCHRRGRDAAAGRAGSGRARSSRRRSRPTTPRALERLLGPGARARLHGPAGGRGAPARRRRAVPPAGGLRQRRPAVRALARRSCGRRWAPTPPADGSRRCPTRCSTSSSSRRRRTAARPRGRRGSPSTPT